MPLDGDIPQGFSMKLGGEGGGGGGGGAPFC